MTELPTLVDVIVSVLEATEKVVFFTNADDCAGAADESEVCHSHDLSVRK